MAAPTVQGTLERAKKLFQAQFNTTPTLAVSAPGRVNLIGEHTDYNDGFVMPLALNGRHTVVVGKKTEGGVIKIATEASVGGDHNVELKASKSGVSSSKEPKWANYVKGSILQFYKKTGGEEREEFDSFDIAITTDVPLGGGLSSSAALEVAIFTFLEALTGITLDKKEKALLAQKAENEFVGMPCGCMDQFISVMGKESHALLLDCRSQDTKYVPLTDNSIVLLVTNSNVKHELVGGEYAERRSQCYEGVDILKKTYPTIKALRDVTLDQLTAHESQLPKIVFRRSRHVISENDRTTQAADAFAKRDYELCGKLMVESHNSLRDDYEVSCKELDLLVKIALEVEGVYGSRITGGGFGGCSITLLKTTSLDKTIAHIQKRYTEATGITPTIFATIPGEGAGILTL